MKLLSSLVLAVALGFSASALVGCATVVDTGEDDTPRGISAEGTGYTRESVYDWQDRSIRELAY